MNRCKTCRHFERSFAVVPVARGRSGWALSGGCDRPDHGPGSPAFAFSSEGPALLIVTDDFGCTLHEPVEVEAGGVVLGED